MVAFSRRVWYFVLLFSSQVGFDAVGVASSRHVFGVVLSRLRPWFFLSFPIPHSPIIQLSSHPIDYRIVPGSFPNPVVSVGVCFTAVDAAAGGLTTGWWAVVLECFSSHLLHRTS